MDFLSDFIVINDSIHLQPIHHFEEEALLILERIYGSTREKELAQTDWPEEHKAFFINLQFAAQHDYYQKVYPHAWYGFIKEEEKVAGRLYVNFNHPSDIRIIDIALLPDFRNKNIGSSVLLALQKWTASQGKPLSIHVEQFNPAKNLYERLGFVHAETYDEVYILMKWTPKANSHDTN